MVFNKVFIVSEFALLKKPMNFVSPYGYTVVGIISDITETAKERQCIPEDPMR
ncbi:MAG: hypothetical protein ACJ71P_10565 [Nitrososphaeraceae archaeon]